MSLFMDKANERDTGIAVVMRSRRKKALRPFLGIIFSSHRML